MFYNKEDVAPITAYLIYFIFPKKKKPPNQHPQALIFETQSGILSTNHR